jgi:hypothetical protein
VRGSWPARVFLLIGALCIHSAPNASAIPKPTRYLLLCTELNDKLRNKLVDDLEERLRPELGISLELTDESSFRKELKSGADVLELEFSHERGRRLLRLLVKSGIHTAKPHPVTSAPAAMTAPEMVGRKSNLDTLATLVTNHNQSCHTDGGGSSCQ